MKKLKPAPIVSRAQEGKSVSMAGGTYHTLVSGKETNGEYAIIDMLIQPGAGPVLHAHPNMHESLYVIDGEIEVKSEAGNYTVKKGSTITIPKGGIVHAFKNQTDKIAYLLCTVIPSGLEEMFMELGTPVAPGTFLPLFKPDPDTLKKIQQVGEKYGNQSFPPNYLD